MGTWGGGEQTGFTLAESKTFFFVSRGRIFSIFSLPLERHSGATYVIFSMYRALPCLARYF